MTSQEILGSALRIIIMLIMMPHPPWKGENFQLLLGKTLGGTISNKPHMTMLLRPATAWSLLLQDLMLMPTHLPAVNVIAQNWRMMIWSLCLGMRLKDAPLQGKMVLMHFVKCICGIHIVLFFRILDCGLSCKFFMMRMFIYADNFLIRLFA